MGVGANGERVAAAKIGAGWEKGFEGEGSAGEVKDGAPAGVLDGSDFGRESFRGMELIRGSTGVATGK